MIRELDQFWCRIDIVFCPQPDHNGSQRSADPEPPMVKYYVEFISLSVAPITFSDQYSFTRGMHARELCILLQF
jgi:hypothetical protein